MSSAAAAGVAVSPASTLSPRTRRLLEGPVAPTLLRLAAPNVLVMVLQAAVSTLDAVFVGWLGSDALAGVSLVFPLVMLMQTMSAGGMGGGVASAVARALGGGRRAEADALVVHALVIAMIMAAAFTLLLELGGPALYHAMGGDGGAGVRRALSRVLFGGALAYWLFNTLGSVIRGTGNMALPASVMVGSGCLYLALSPPSSWAGARCRDSASRARPRPASPRSAWAASRCSASSSPAGAWCGRPARPAPGLGALLGDPPRGRAGLAEHDPDEPDRGAADRAGRALRRHRAGRLRPGRTARYLQIPIVFGLGSGLVTMVGPSMGAGHRARAQRVAWVGAAMAAGVTGTIGILAALFPHACSACSRATRTP